MEKIRAHKLAKDIQKTSKDVIAVLNSYGISGKNYMSILAESDLDIVFEHYTQECQVPDLCFVLEQNDNAEECDELLQKESLNEGGDAAVEETGSVVEVGSAPKQRYVNTKVDVVDLDKIEVEKKLEELVPQNVENIQKKQKIKKGSQHRIADKSSFGTIYKETANNTAKKSEKFHVSISDEISVASLAKKINKAPAEVVKSLFDLGVMASVSQMVSFDIASLIVEDAGGVVEREFSVTEEEKLFNDAEDPPESLKTRSPVVVIMGHVDHGKTSLLDAIRNTNVAAKEFGGITQHIGAHCITVNDKKITFLDTPGHEAFTAMRARGAFITDIAILVVAADDGVMPQTIEAINHAKAANISVIVAINKIDKENANVDKVKQGLADHGLLAEEWGGDTVCVEVSAHKKIGLKSLLEMVLLLAEMKELKANANRAARGTVIEAKLDKNRGPAATLLVQNGTLKLGNVVVVGTAVGRVRAMVDDKGKDIKSAGPSVPVEVLGLSEVPEGGDPFYVVEDEKKARQLVEVRKLKIKQDSQEAYQNLSLENLFSKIEEGKINSLNIIIKADVQGSLEAVRQSLEKIGNDEVKVKVIHGAVGAVTESDVMLASASAGVIVGFNVRPTIAATSEANRQKVDIRNYRVIYDAVADITSALKGMLAPRFKEVIIGHMETRAIYKVSGIGIVGGAYVMDGKIQRGNNVRILRDSVVIHDGTLASLKRFKDDVKEVTHGYECGFSIEKYNDIKEGDIIEAYIMEKIDAELNH